MASIVSQLAKLDAEYAKLTTKVMPKALATALNKSAALAKTRTIKGVSKSLTLQQKIVRDRIRVVKATPKRPVAKILAYTFGIPVIRLKPRDSGKGGWRKRTGSGVKIRGHHFRDAYITHHRDGTPHVKRRKGRARTPTEIVSIPIRERVIQVGQVAAERVMKQRFQQLLEHEINRQLTAKGVR